MRASRKILTAGLVGLGLLALIGVDRAGAASARYSGVVLSVDHATGTIVVGVMGPKLENGKSEMARRRVQVTPSTSYVLVKRAAGVAPSGWLGDYVETSLTAADIKPGEWVTVSIDGDPRRPTAVKITVVDMSER